MSKSTIADLLAKGDFKKVARFGREVLPLAHQVLSDPDWQVRRSATQVLG